MAKKNIQESQQQSQNVTIGTQGNEDQPTPHGDDLGNQQRGGQEERQIPNQERSSSSHQQRQGNTGDRKE